MNDNNSLTVDSDFSDELVINEEVEEYKRMNYSSSEEEEEFVYKPSAPPPSPQEPSMLEMIFEEIKPIREERGFMEHAQTLDKLLRKTINQQQNSNKICKKRRTSWTNLEKQQKLKNMMKKAAAGGGEFKKALMIDDETSLVIHELREMGL